LEFRRIKGKEHEARKESARHGDVWTWTAIDADSKLIISWLVGNLDAVCATEFVKDVASRLKNHVQITTELTAMTQTLPIRAIFVDPASCTASHAPNGLQPQRTSLISAGRLRDGVNAWWFVWKDPVEIVPRGPRYRGKVVILVDELSISNSEFTATDRHELKRIREDKPRLV
jgi:hypothetical protein